jgi:hypothetical protein
MAKNNLSDLKDYLFESIERLNAEDCDLDKEVKRATILVETSKQVVDIFKTEYQATKLMLQYGYTPTDQVAENLGLEKATKQIL